MVRVWWGCGARCSPNTQGVREGQVKPREVRPLSCAPWPERASSRATSQGHRCAPWPPRGTASPRQACLRGCHRRAPWTRSPRVCEPSLWQPRCRCRLPSLGSASVGRTGGVVVRSQLALAEIRLGSRWRPHRDPLPWGGRGLLSRGRSWPSPRSAQALAGGLPEIRLRRHHHLGAIQENTGERR
jgi:hypothetical protein